MTAICIDDEPILLDWLCKTVMSSPDIEKAEKFTNELSAIGFAEENPFDIAFLDIELHALDGVAVAEKLRKISPECGIVFCTGHSSYAVDAIARLRVDGYLLKPIEPSAVQREIDRFKERSHRSTPLLTVDFTGGINIFDRAFRPVRFRRTLTEQLFSELVKQNGRSLSTRELCETLWHDTSKSSYLYKKNENYLTQLFTDLRHSLELCGAQEILKKTADGYSISMPLVKIIGEEPM